MTIEEAIEHARKVAEGCQEEDGQCAYQHDELADWLEELKAYRDTGLTPGKIENLTRALDAAAKLLTGYGHCTHCPGYICDKGFTTPGVCEVCIKEHLLGQENAKEG